MIESRNFKRASVKSCWIQHLLNGQFLEEENSIFTIFGETRRVKLVATVRGKQEFLSDDDPTKSRVVLYLDDGTGLLNATIWQSHIERYGYIETLASRNR